MPVQLKNIFIVDDDELTSTILRDHLLENPLYSVSLFKTGEECLKHLDLKPDVVILDYTLNSVVRSAADGLEILQEIRRSVPNVHVIMLSSQDDYARALETIVKGAIEYVVKNNDAFSRIDHILAG